MVRRKTQGVADSGTIQLVATWVENKICVICIHCNEHVYLMAEVHLLVGGQTFLIPAALAPRLPYAIIVSDDFPTLRDLVQQARKGKSNAQNSVTTKVPVTRP